MIRWSLMGLALLVLILVPFALWEESVVAVAERWLREGTGRLTVAVAVPTLLALDVVLPVPSSVVATGSGVLLGLGQGASVAWLGLQLGAAMGYLVGRTLGIPAARRLVGPAELERAERSHSRWGPVSLLACRAVPVLAESSVIVAGAVRMPLRRFVWLTGLPNAAIALVYASVGAYALEVRAFLLAFVASIALPGLLMGAYRAAERRGSEGPAPAAGHSRASGTEEAQ